MLPQPSLLCKIHAVEGKMKSGVIISICLLVCISIGASGQVASGRVFEDSNGNGVLDSNEAGVANVRVSNGTEIVLTGADGAYSLEIDDEAIIFITKPKDYATPVNNHNLPQFYYIHQPDGSPEGLRFPGIEPTGPLPQRVNFALQKRQEPLRFEAILLADTQPETDAELDYIRDDVVSELIGTVAKFGMTMGDLLFDDMSMFPRFNSIVGQVGVPWYNVPGNHELNLSAENDQYSLETFKRYFGPSYYSFEYGDAVFIVLDNIFYNGGGEVTADNLRGSGGYVAKFDKAQLKWLERELSYIPEDKLIFLAMHSPLKTYVGDHESANTSNRKALFKLLGKREHLYSVAGHTHTTEHLYFGKEDGFKGKMPFHHHVLSTVSGSWWSGPFDVRGIPTTDQRDGTPNGYHILEVDGVAASVRFKAAGQAADYQMRITFDVAQRGHSVDGMRDYRLGELIDGDMSVDAVPAAAVVVNVFDGGPNTRVSFSVAGRDSIVMQKVFLKDPLMNEVLQRNKETKKSWVEALPSSHLWMADLPDDLTPGTYTVSVQAIDEFGRSHHAHRILEIHGTAANKTGLSVFR